MLATAAAATASHAVAEPLTDAALASFRSRGYLILSDFLPEEMLRRLRRECDQCINRAGSAATIVKRGCILEPCDYKKLTSQERTERDSYSARRQAELGEDATGCLLFWPRLLHIVSMLLGCGENAGPYLFNEQFIVKPGEFSRHTTVFPWHQDAENIPWYELEYVSVWCALDDMSEENGTLYIGPLGGPRPADAECSEAEMPLWANAGDVVIMSSRLWHRSGPNISGLQRRAYMPQYSIAPITLPRQPGEIVTLAVPTAQ